MIELLRLVRRHRLTHAALLASLFVLCEAWQPAAAEDATHHHYKLVDLGTLGGPLSFPSGPGAQVLNNAGTFVAYANTAAANPNPNCALPFNANGGGGDCFVEHPVLWRSGTLTDLPLLPGGVNGQTGWVAANGLVSGWSENGLTDPAGLPVGRAVLWTKHGKIIDLGVVPGGIDSLATAVNNDGQAVGFSDNGVPDAFSMAGLATQTRAFLWQHGNMEDLGTLGGPDAVAFFLNERGQVAGQAYTNSTPNPATGIPIQHPFFWENGHMLDIGSLGGTVGTPNWMNSRGQVVGASDVAGDQNAHPFFWDETTGLKDLGLLPGGSNGNATWINDAGDIVGGSDSLTGIHAVLWKKGAIIDLGIVAGDCGSQATAINSKGQIVGYGTLPIDCGNEAHGILFENGATPIDLNTLMSPGSTVTFLNAFNINDRGEIAGYGVLANGNPRAFLLIPCDADHPGIEGCDYSLVKAAK